LQTVNCSVVGSADVDLFMSFSNSYFFTDCLSMTLGSGNEKCVIGPYMGTAYIWMFAWAPSAVNSLVCSTHFIEGGSTELVSGVASSSFSVATNQTAYFYIKVSNVSTVSCETSSTSSTGDIDLYMTWDFAIDGQCISSTNGMNESCSLDDPNRGIAFAFIYGYEGGTGVTITCTALPVTAITLANNVEFGPYSLAEWEYTLFTLDVPTPSLVTCKTSSKDGDLDLFMNLDGSNKFLCRSMTMDSNEDCRIRTTAAAGKAYIYTAGYYAVEKYTIICSLSA